MPKRVSIYILAALAALTALVIGIYAGVLNTGAGRRAVLDALEPTLEQALGGEVKVGGTGGHWPNFIILRDVMVADSQGVWLRLDEVALRWNPLALLSGRVSIDELKIPGGTLVRLPQGADQEPETPDLPRLPDLPDLEIGSLTVGALEVKAAAAGRDTVLQISGMADMRPGMLRLSLKGGTDGEQADRADIAIDWTPAEERLAADVQVRGPEGGLIARLLGVDGSVSVSAGGTGPASDWTGTLTAQAGGFGSLSGKLACECGVPPKLKLDLGAEPGPALSENLRRYLGASPRIEAAIFSEQPSALTFEVTALELAAGKLTRPLRVSLTETGRLLRFDLSAAIAPGPALKDGIPPWAGEEFRLLVRGGFPREGGVRVAEASIASQAAKLSIESATLGPDGSLDGIGSLDVVSTQALPETVAQLAGEQARLAFDLAGVWGETLRLEDVILETASGTRAAGLLAWDLEAAALNTELDLRLPGPVFAALTGLPEPGEAVTGKLTAEGPPAKLSAKLEATTPQLELDARTLPPARAVLSLRGGLDDPSGELTVRRLDEEQKPVVLSADLAWPGREILHVTALSAQLDGATLKGEAHIATGTGHVTGEAQLDVPDLSALSTQATGSLNGRISLKREAEGRFVLSAEGTAPELGYGNVEAEDARISASGPLSGLTVTGKAERVTVPDTGPIRDFEFAAEADLSGPPAVSVTKLAASVSGTPVALSAPAMAAVSDGTIALSEARFSWGEKGTLTAQATLTPEALKASLEMSKAAVPGESVLVTGSVRVDTEEKRQPGALNLRLEPQDGPAAALEITGTWNGQRLDLTGNLKGSGKQAGKVMGEIITASIPLTLTRTDGSFSVSTEGALKAAVRYKGKLEPLLAIFLTKPERDIAGVLDANVQVGGTLKAPEVKGAMALAQGRYENARAGLELSAINARLDFAGGAEGASGTLKLTAWDRKDAKDGQPPVTGEGRFTVAPEGLRVNADLRLRDATLVRRRDLTATLTGNARLTGVLPELELAGAVRIDRLDLLIPENGPEGIKDVPVVLVNEKGEPLDREKDEEAAEEERKGLVVALDLKIRSDGRAFIRGRGLDSEWKADSSVGGTIEQPELNGALTLKKGTFNFAGRRFTLSKGEVIFTGQTPPDPVLDIVAEYETEEDTTALVSVSGRTSEPSVKLDSRPPLPREQVMALVLFGKPVKELTALQALQVTQSVAQLTGTGPFGGGSIMDRARRTLGLDLLDLTFGKENGDVGLKVGRYVSEGIFISATQDVTGEAGKVSVEVEITDEFSIETDVGQDASGGVSAQWKKDY